MFEKNDKVLRIFRIAFLIAIIILAITTVVVGIICTVKISGVYFLIVPFGLLICYIIWLRGRLVLSFYCDIKLIRNKLYGESNEYLEDFLKSYGDRVAELDEQEQKEEEKEAELAHLYQLMNSGVITPEEYEMRVNELTKED